MAAGNADNLFKVAGDHTEQNRTLYGRNALCQGSGHFRVGWLDSSAVYNGVRSFNLAGFMADIYLDAKTFQMIGKRGRNAIRTGYGISLMMHNHRQTVHAAAANADEMQVLSFFQCK